MSAEAYSVQRTRIPVNGARVVRRQQSQQQGASTRGGSGASAYPDNLLSGPQRIRAANLERGIFTFCFRVERFRKGAS